MMKKCLLAMLLSLSACEGEALETKASDNAKFEVETLFNHDGCTVYRFYDMGCRYFVRCDSGQLSTRSTQRCGKNCSKQIEINTDMVKK